MRLRKYPNPRHLVMLCKVCETKSLTHAAKVLHSTQPTISFALDKLERVFGVSLRNKELAKQTGELHLTPAAFAIAKRAKSALCLLDEMMHG